MRYALCLGALTTILFAPGAQAAILEEFSVKDWSGMALADDQTGRLASCAIYSKFQNGATLFLIKHKDGGWALSLVHADWALAENTPYPLQYRVDREPYVAETGIALGSDQIGVTLPDDDPVIAQIRRGTLLTVLFAGKEYGFELSNSGKALQATKECVERNRDAVAPQIANENPLPPTSPGIAAGDNPVAEWPGANEQTAAQQGPSAQPSFPDSAEAPHPNERQAFAGWVVSATRDDKGHFLNCTAFAIMGEDQLMLSHHADDGWDFGLYRPSWALNADRTYELLFNVDGPAEGPGGTLRAVEAVEPTRVAFEVSDPLTLLGRLERGRQLAIELRSGAAVRASFRFPLHRAAEAFEAARECTRRNAHGT
jgi:hypothetical protein